MLHLHISGSFLFNLLSNNLIIGYDIDAPSATGSNQLNIGNLIYGTSIDGTGTTKSSGNIGIGDSSPEAKLKVNGTVLATAFNGDGAEEAEVHQPAKLPTRHKRRSPRSRRAAEDNHRAE